MMSNDEQPRVDRFFRTPGGPFDDFAKEEFAKARAKGGSIAASSGVAGITNVTGSKWNRHPDMLGRIAELRSGAETFVGVSKGWILSELKRNVEMAREAGQLKSSNEALKLMYEIVNTDKDVGANMARALPPGTTTADVEKRFLESREAANRLPAQTAPRVADMIDAEGEEMEVERG